MKNVSLVVLIFFISIVSLNTQNAYCKNATLEFDDVHSFAVENLQGTKNQIIISGLAMTSFFAVGSVTITFHENSLCIYITMTKPQKWLRGDFSVPIIIPDKVNEIYFGHKKKLIWMREHNPRE